MASKQAPPKSYTLKEVIADVMLAIQQMNEPEQHDPGADPSGRAPTSNELRAPAMPTMKIWSKDGFFKNAPQLHQATALVLERLRSRSRYYAGAHQGQEATPDRPSAAVPRSPLESGNSNQEILAGIRSLGLRLNDIEKYMVNPVPLPQAAQAGKADNAESVTLGKILKAVEQLDATRRHIMLRFDSETQLMKQAAAPGGRQFEAASALDVQRILARLSNVEGLLNQVLDKK